VTPEAFAWLAGQSVGIDDAELRPAIRRAMLLLAAGGDPRRELDRDERAVTALAAELDTPGRRATLVAGLEALRDEAAAVAADPELAWRAFACALLAEELDEG
jgi:hypothetical protein